MINDQIRRARLLQGMSLDEVAQRMGDITKQGLSKFEKGLALPNSTRLLQLSRVLGVKPEYFFRSDSVQLAPLEFRKLSSMPKKRQQQIEERVRDVLERYIRLEQCFGLGDAAPAPVQAPRVFDVHNGDDAESAAGQLRAQWAIGGDAIAHLTEMLEDHGIKVALLDHHDDFDGACATTHDECHVLIALNRERPGERVRFTAAHELGHWVMTLPEAMPEKEREGCCHRFAGAFLYPRHRVEADFGTHLRHRVLPIELLNAKRRYGISMSAALRRLKDLRLISDAGYQSMNIQFSINGWRSAEPERLLPERPRRFESMVYRALAEDLISRSRAAEFLQCSVAELEPAFTGLPV